MSCRILFAAEVKQPGFAGSFYPADPKELSAMIEGFLEVADPEPLKQEIFALISPHAGYGYSGQTAAYGFKLIKGRPYKTVVIIGPSHQYGLNGVSVYPKGTLRTPLGEVEVDEEFTRKLLNKDKDVIFEPRAFEKEHSLEVQLPFLQKTLSGFKVVPIVMGDCPLSVCRRLAELLKAAIAGRNDVLVIASSDFYHGYDYEDAEMIDKLACSYLEKMDAEELYFALREGRIQLCGGFPVVATIILSKESGHNKLKVLHYTNSCEVTGKKKKGIWTVGYASCVIDAQGSFSSDSGAGQGKGEQAMLNKEQRGKLLEIARGSIQTYLKTGKKMRVTERDPLLHKELGAFVTLHNHGQLRGCIGNLIGRGPLYLTVGEMAVEAARDSRFPPVELSELKDIEIEISVLSPMERVDSAEKIELGRHGVMVKRGPRSGVFLPQVATETGWTKKEFLSALCSHKAGLAPDAWKDKATEIYIFTAEVFSEENIMGAPEH